MGRRGKRGGAGVERLGSYAPASGYGIRIHNIHCILLGFVWRFPAVDETVLQSWLLTDGPRLFPSPPLPPFGFPLFIRRSAGRSAIPVVE